MTQLLVKPGFHSFPVAFTLFRVRSHPQVLFWGGGLKDETNDVIVLPSFLTAPPPIA